MEKEKLCRIHINELISEINNYNLSLHKLTYRYGIDYIKYNLEFKEKYPQIIKELSDNYIYRKVIMVQSPSIDNDTIECANKHELYTMVGIPKANRVINDGIEYIEDLKWESLSECTEEEILNYKDKLTLTISVYGEYKTDNELKKEYFKNELLSCLEKNKLTKNTHPYIIKGVNTPYKTKDGGIEPNIYHYHFIDLYFCKNSSLNKEVESRNPEDWNFHNIGHFIAISFNRILTYAKYDYSYFDITELLWWFEDYLKENYVFTNDKILVNNKIINCEG